ncbi:MerR family transcriptional regulator [Thermovenabulum sp.]|uniref:MerR family transcriptional regulator n=1 Tax=Thermovenabulum sp. TaxID=3100335 RepID=UPI003C7D2B7E
MEKDEKGFYGIGAVEQRTGLSARQIRYYENLGLIKPERTEGGQRRYTERDVLRLLRIKYLKENGFDLKSIKEKIEEFERELPLESIGDLSPAELKISSLYPVSNRAILMKLLDKIKDGK